jgi:8-oxo-dGTP diphosphatase
MELLLTLSDTDVGTEAVHVAEYEPRLAARAIVFKGSSIDLLHVSNDHYYKLPGGGVEPGESVENGLRREVLEEVGGTIRVTGEVGLIVEHRSQYRQLQTSHCFLAEIEQEGTPSFTSEETDDGFRLIWMSLDEALRLLRESSPATYLGKFIVKRDLRFLEKTKEILSKQQK